MLHQVKTELRHIKLDLLHSYTQMPVMKSYFHCAHLDLDVAPKYVILSNFFFPCQKTLSLMVSESQGKNHTVIAEIA